jgi:hypothetical protein
MICRDIALRTCIATDVTADGYCLRGTVRINDPGLERMMV